MELKPFKVKADIYWAFFDTPNPMSDKGEFTVDLCNLSPDASQKIEDMGGEVKSKDTKPEQGKFITAKSKYLIEPTDEAGNPVEGKVGNGSKAVVLLSPWEWSWKGKKGVRFTPKSLVVTNLVVYEKSSKEVSTDDVL
jgi:hypothetical protein